MAGFAIFSVLGFMTYEQGVDISEVAESGKYLVPYTTNYGNEFAVPARPVSVTNEEMHLRYYWTFARSFVESS